MQIDIITLKIVLCIINSLNLVILLIQYFSYSYYKSILYWVAGFGFIALSQFVTLNNFFPFPQYVAITSDVSILIGFSVISIGIKMFLESEVHIKKELIITAVFVIGILLSFLLDYKVTEKFFLAIVKSIICYQIASNLYFGKAIAIKKSANFIAVLFFIYATVFLIQGVSVIVSGAPTSSNSFILIIIYLFSIVLGIISTFGFTFLLNESIIGERDKAEWKLQLTQYAINNTSDAVFWIRKNGSFLELNKSACKILGYSYDELILLTVPHIDPDYNEKFWPIHWEELKKNQSMTFTSTHLTKSGLVKATEVNANYIYYNGEEINCAFVRDITERKKAEDKVKELMFETIDKNNRLQNFAHIVSHNIRSHSANFKGLLDIITTAETEDEKQVYFEYLNASSLKLNETIDNLNEIISIQTETNLTYEKLNLKVEIEKTIKSQIHNINSVKIKIINNVVSPIFIKVIPAYLDSILLNLITNAIKYRANIDNPEIKIDCSQNNGLTELIIEDNGIGIDLIKNGAKLFGMYKTFNGNSDAKGIGLFITKNQVEAMKGKIEVVSKLGVGTTFKIYFNNA